MRLETKEISAITSAIREYDPQYQIYLFGSRMDGLNLRRILFKYGCCQADSAIYRQKH